MLITIVLLGIMRLVLTFIQANEAECLCNEYDCDWCTSEYERHYRDGLALFDAIASDLTAHTVKSIDECGSMVRKTMVVNREARVLSYEVTSNYAMRTNNAAAPVRGRNLHQLGQLGTPQASQVIRDAA